MDRSLYFVSIARLYIIWEKITLNSITYLELIFKNKNPSNTLRRVIYYACKHIIMLKETICIVQYHASYNY